MELSRSNTKVTATAATAKSPARIMQYAWTLPDHNSTRILFQERCIDSSIQFYAQLHQTFFQIWPLRSLALVLFIHRKWKLIIICAFNYFFKQPRHTMSNPFLDDNPFLTRDQVVEVALREHRNFEQATPFGSPIPPASPASIASNATPMPPSSSSTNFFTPATRLTYPSSPASEAWSFNGTSPSRNGEIDDLVCHRPFTLLISFLKQIISTAPMDFNFF